MTKDRFERTARNIVVEFAKGCSCGAPGECADCLNGAVNALVEACRAEVNETTNSMIAAQIEKERQRYEREKYNRKTVEDYLKSPVVLFMLNPWVVASSAIIVIVLTIWGITQ